MKLLLIDAGDNFVDFALRAEAYGHEVRVFMGPDKKNQRYSTGDGLIDKVTDWKPSMKWADLVVTSDNCKYLHLIDSYRGEVPIFSATSEVAQWELERQIGQDILTEAGISCLPSTVFRSYDEAIAFQLKNKETRYVAKPLGDADKALSYVSKSARDMLFMLDKWKKTEPPRPFLFQEFTPGIEMAVGGWMGRDGFLSHFLENFEFKKLMNGEVGVNTGEMGTVMKYVTADESKLAREMLLPLEAELIRQGYTGYIDVAVIIDGKGCPWPLEFTCRPGWPCFQIQQALHNEPVEWMLDACNGVDNFRPSKEVAVGVVVAIPDFPFNDCDVEDSCGYPVWGISAKNRFNVHPCSMKAGTVRNEDLMVTSGTYVLVVSGTGQNVEIARKRAYQTLKELEIPNSPMYRTDIGCRLEDQLIELNLHGYATAWEW